MTEAQHKALTAKLLPIFWKEVTTGKSALGKYINATGHGKISDIQMYILEQLQYKIDSSYNSNTSDAVFNKLDLRSKIFNPENDPMVETGANGLWQDLDVGVSAQTAGSHHGEKITNFLKDILSYIHGTASIGKLEGDFNTIAIQYYENNNPGSTSKTSTSTSQKPTGSTIANIYNTQVQRSL